MSFKHGMIVFVTGFFMLFIAKLSGVYPEQPAQITIITPPVASTVQQDTTYIPLPDQSPTTLTREQEIANSIGIDVPVKPGPCNNVAMYSTGTVLACFVIPDNVIYITEAGMSLDNVYLKCVLTHENRHVYQFRNGMWNIDNQTIMNREELEADAEAFAGC